VLHAFHALFTQIDYYALPSTVVDVSADVEKGINVMENQQHGATHSHCFMADSAQCHHWNGWVPICSHLL